MHTRRIIAPRFWGAGKKKAFWVVTPKSGKHSHKKSIPITCILRDILKVAGNLKEVKAILSSGQVKVDGVVCRNHAQGAGFMDVITLDSLNRALRIVPYRGGLKILDIPKKETHLKLLKVTNKHAISNAKVQLTFHDSTNIVVGIDDSKSYRPGDTVKFDLAKKHAVDIIPLKAGNIALVYDGAHSGKIVKIVRVNKNKNGPDTVSLKSGAGKKFDTLKDYLLVVGTEKPELTVMEE